MRNTSNLCIFPLIVFFIVGCGGKDSPETTVDATPVAADSSPTPVESEVAPPPPGPELSESTLANPEVADPLANFRANQSDPDAPNSDLQALQQVVDGYSFGPDGLGAPPLKSLNDLVTKGYLKRLPEPPDGKKWAYDSQKWKVSLVNK